MFKTKSTCKASASFAVLATLMLAINTTLYAADHQEAPTATARLSADIGDYFAWHDDSNLNLVLTYGTFAAPSLPATYNRDELYGFHFDTSETPDGVSEIDIYARFSQDTDGNWGIQVSGIGAQALEGAIETQLSNGQMTVWAGLADDPFFFDQAGFNETVTTGTLSFDPTNDDVAGLNVTAISIQLPIAAIVASGDSFQTWATTATASQ